MAHLTRIALPLAHRAGLQAGLCSIFAASLVSITAATPSALPAAQADLDLLAVSGETIPGTTTELIGVSGIRAGVDGAWAARALLATSPPGSEFGILGDLSADASLGASILRRPMPVAGFDQIKLGVPEPFQGQLGYLASDSGGLITRYQGAFIDDALVAREGDPVGSTGRQWGTFSRIVLRPGGQVFLRGGSPQGGMLYARHSDTILVSIGDPVPMMSGPITGIGRFEISPDGQHWVARVTAGQNREAIIVDGAVLMLGGNPVIEGRDISPVLGIGTGTWGDFFDLDVDNSGRVTFQASTSAPIGDAPTIRGEQVIQLGIGPAAAPEFEDVAFDALGVFSSGPIVLLEDQVIASANATIDADGDGQADPGYSIGSNTLGDADWQVRAVSNALVGSVFLTVPGVTGDRQAIVRFQTGQEGDSTCAGVTNSTGRASTLEAFGRSGASANELTLYCVDLPAGCMGYAIGSRQSGLVMNPGGSAGNLCLGGSIGRFIPQMFTVGTAGRGVVDLDLAALPQPMGTVSAVAGDIWFFQVWHRDLCSGPAATSNFSNAVSVQITN